MESVTARLKLSRACKHSQRFDAIDPVDAKVLTAIYVMNEAIEVLGDPEIINVSIVKEE